MSRLRFSIGGVPSARFVTGPLQVADWLVAESDVEAWALRGRSEVEEIVWSLLESHMKWVSVTATNRAASVGRLLLAMNPLNPFSANGFCGVPRLVVRDQPAALFPLSLGHRGGVSERGLCGAALQA